MYITDDSDLPEILTRGPSKPLPPMDVTFIQPGQADWERSFLLINRYQKGNPYQDLGFEAGQAFETTPQVYDYFLDVVPPLYMRGPSFVMGEMVTETLAESFHKIGDRYFCLLIEWTERARLSAGWAGLIAAIRPGETRTADGA